MEEEKLVDWLSLMEWKLITHYRGSRIDEINEAKASSKQIINQLFSSAKNK